MARRWRRAGSGALDQFTTDLTAQARAGKIDPILGRDTEIRQIIDILTRRRQNNPILTGEAGVGKTAVVEGFAVRLASGDVPPALQGVTLRTLDLGLLQAGAGVKGEFENRLQGVIDEVKASPKPIIMFIDEAHQLIGAGGSAGQGDAANLLKPALARGELRTIAATTWAEYKKYFEKDAALTRRFQVVKVDEPSEPMAVAMVRGLVATLEKHHNVRILDEAVSEAVRLSARYIPSRQLPDKAVSLIDTACARVGMSQAAMPPPLEDRQRRIALIDTEVGDPGSRDRRRRAASGAARGPAGGARDARAGTHRARGALGAGEGAGRRDRRDARQDRGCREHRRQGRAAHEAHRHIGEAARAAGRDAADLSGGRSPGGGGGGGGLDRHPDRPHAVERDPHRAEPEAGDGGAHHRPAARAGRGGAGDPHQSRAG